MTAPSAGSASHPDEPRRSRICSHIESGQSFGMVGALRSDLSSAENTKRHESLARRIRDSGHGVIEVRCVHCVDEGVMLEGLLFVPGVSRNTLMKIGEACEQHAVLFTNDAECALVCTDASLGIGEVVASYAHGGRSDPVAAMEAIRDFCVGALQRSRVGAGLEFDVQEREAWSFNQAAYSNRGEEPGWITFLRGIEPTR